MKEKLILVGRIMNGNRLVGAKFINLQTLESMFVRFVNFPEVFKSYDVVNCKYGNQGLRSTRRNFTLKSLAVYSPSSRLIKSGARTDSDLVSRELHVDTDKIVFYICDALVCGAISDPFSRKAVRHAEMYYDEIRAMTSDVNRIARNTGVPVKDIIKIKNYLFMDMHDLLGGHRYFDASFHIAQSWQRLMSKDGKDIKPHDMTLIKHELYEMGLVESGMSQDDAHNATSKIYDYKKESNEYYAKINRNKKKR